MDNIDAIALVEKGKKGVTNKQMIPVMKTLVDAGETDKLVALTTTFPLVFKSAAKYIGSHRMAKLNEIMPAATEEEAI